MIAQKNILLLILVLSLSTSGCISYQILQASSSSPHMELDTKSNTLVFNNDSIAIYYSFWREKGTMAFQLINLLDVPVYIDWRKSSYISGMEKFDYWTDQTLVEGNATTSTNGFINKKGILPDFSSVSNTNFSQTITKIERITFLPPQTSITISKFFLKPSGKYNLVSDKVQNIKSEHSKKSIQVVKCSKEDTPLTFRNYISWSLTEDFSTEYHVDNVFYVTKITQATKKDFIGTKTLNGNTYIYEYPYEKPNSFYIKVL